MQYQGPARVENGSAAVLFLLRAVVPHTGSYAVGEGLTFGGGAAGVVTAYSPGLLSFVLPGDSRPAPGDTIDGDTSLVSTTLTSYDLDPGILNFGVAEGDLVVREGDRVPYMVSAAPQAWRLTLTAPYAGVSGLAADVNIHTTRTPFADFPLFDRRDRELHPLLNDFVTRLDAILADFEDRLTALE